MDAFHETIERLAEELGDASFLLAPGREPLTFAGLAELDAATSARLGELGLGRGDRIATSLPNGPEAAASFLVFASSATCAPLNPTYRASEVEFYLSDLGAAALVVPEGALDGEAATAARKLGVPIVELCVAPNAAAGAFTLAGEPNDRAADRARPTLDDSALVLHTSGTTSRPKVVPLSQRNLAASAASIRATLELGPEDRCLNVMPLFHIHGLLGVLCSSLHAGAAVVATPGFSAPHFFDLVREYEPSWYSAVPTMHQAVLARAEEHTDVLRERRLRFVRSSSAALPPTVLAELERVFGAPVIEAYGMTEASHQMACNPLPPRPRKPGSVGPAAGPEVAVLDEDWNPVAPGVVGEVSIRGANVTAGYEANDEANRAAFRDGWFRTGDQGYLDDDGYLFLTGRLKEIINRGGEKVSPREIDEVLLEHPRIAQALAFAMPDPELGEEIAAAIVLEPGQRLEKRELLAFAAERLADFKLPREVVVLDEIPKGPTGKLQRIGLAEKLGVGGGKRGASAGEERAPATPNEELLAALFAELLRRTDVHARSDFFALGGDSLSAATLVQRVAERTGITIPVYELFDEPTVAALAAFVDGAEPDDAPATLASAGPGPHALSPLQAGLWVQERLAGGSPINHRFGALALRGPVDAERLEQALARVLERHDVLRSVFPAPNRRPVQALSDAPPPALARLDLSESPDAERVAAERARELAAEPFDLAAGPIARFELVTLDQDRHLLFTVVHHIAFDGWSMATFTRDLAAAYDREALPTAAEGDVRPVQYADFAAWLNARIEGGELAGDVEYWRSALVDLTPFELPSDPDAEDAEPWSGAREDVVLAPETVTRLRELGVEAGTTLFMTLLAAFDVLLSRWSEREDVAVGTLVAGRTHPAVADTVGLFANTLVLRTDLSGDPSFRELLGRVRTTALDAYAHAEVPFEVVVRELKPPMAMGRNPYFDAVFQMRNLPEVRAETAEVRFAGAPLEPGFARYDLLVEVFEEADEAHTRFEWRTARFGRESMARRTREWRALLESVTAHPEAPLSRLAKE